MCLLTAASDMLNSRISFDTETPSPCARRRRIWTRRTLVKAVAASNTTFAASASAHGARAPLRAPAALLGRGAARASRSHATTCPLSVRSLYAEAAAQWHRAPERRRCMSPTDASRARWDETTSRPSLRSRASCEGRASSPSNNREMIRSRVWHATVRNTRTISSLTDCLLRTMITELNNSVIIVHPCAPAKRRRGAGVWPRVPAPTALDRWPA